MSFEAFGEYVRKEWSNCNKLCLKCQSCIWGTVKDLWWHFNGKLITQFRNTSSSVIRQKGESQNGCFKKTKPIKFSEKRTFLAPDTHTVCVSRGKKCSFFGKFDVLYFLETPVLRFALLPYYRRVSIKISLLQYRSRTSNDMSYSRLIEAMTWVIQGCTVVRNWIRGAVVCKCFSK